MLSNEYATGREQLRDLLSLLGDEVISYSGIVTADLVNELQVDWIISDRNGYILSEEVLSVVEGRALNSHPSLLPWCRGWQPIFFSLLSGLDVGVSIHLIDEGLDTGLIAYQQHVDTVEKDTLKTIHARCRLQILTGWVSILPHLRERVIEAFPQSGSGSYYSRAQFNTSFARLPKGWDTTVEELRSLG